MTLDSDRSRALDWIRQNTSPDDVFLATGLAGSIDVGPCARKVVALETPAMSSPYVSYSKRRAASDAMVAYLGQGMSEPLLSLARKYHVQYVYSVSREGLYNWNERPSRIMVHPALSTIVTEVASFGDVKIYRIRY